MAALTKLTRRCLLLRGRVFEDRPVFLGIVGAPGSGKSTMTDALHDALPEWGVIQMDGFHLSNEVLLGLGRRDRKGSPDTFDVAGFVNTLRRAHTESGIVYAPRFRREIEEPIASSLAINTRAPGVIVEGNYLLLETGGWGGVAPLLDEIWYVDTPTDECRRRLIERASITYGAVAGPKWVDTVDEPNAALVRATADRASLRTTLD